MTHRLAETFRRGRGWLERLPLVALLAMASVIVIGTSAGGFYAYRTYDYVQHDNDFCFSCHLMQEPYELFAQSAHRGLGCKACHQPNIFERSQMGLTAIVENPDFVAEHAPVPNDLCADCHIAGDPEQWTLVANSAGHRVHFESTDTVLDGLQCVECHASSLHEFAPTDRTCAQSGCHEDRRIELGTMGDLTIHCVACHEFNAPLPDESDVAGTLTPDESTCLSCHAMRTSVALPDPDPHDAECASCHDPHTQQTPRQAAESCASSECHADAESLTPFHEGLAPNVAEDCLSCHQAHDFQVDGTNCLACHQGIMEDRPHVPRPSVLDPGVVGMYSWGYPLQVAPDFRHSDHPDVECADCHDSAEGHGVVAVTTATDCRSCHHSGETIEVDGCALCHDSADSERDPYLVPQHLDFSTGGAAERSLPFDHEDHVDEDCASCHTAGLELAATQVECTSCHEEHHEPVNDCSACHVEAPEPVHPAAQSHVTCSGSGCHQTLPFEDVPRTRPACLLCHRELADHRPAGECAECHALSGFER